MDIFDESNYIVNTGRVIVGKFDS